MKYTLSNETVEVAHKFSKIPFVKPLLKPFYYRYKKWLAKKKNQIFSENALDAISKFDSFMKSHGYKYTLGAGTLLGAIREKGFIKHDLDIDTFMWIDDFSQEMIEELDLAGFKLLHTYSIEEGKYGREDTFVYKDIVSIDVFYLYEMQDQYPYVCDWFPFPDCDTMNESIKKHGGLLPRRVHMPVKRKIVYTDFETIKLPIPENAHEVMRYRYGDDYLIPNPKYQDKRDKLCFVMWNDKIATYLEY
jgi:phosphorylcholine metabolism protein LicD